MFCFKETKAVEPKAATESKKATSVVVQSKTDDSNDDDILGGHVGDLIEDVLDDLDEEQEVKSSKKKRARKELTSRERVTLSCRGINYEVPLCVLEAIPESRLAELKKFIDLRKNGKTVDQNDMYQLCDDFSKDMKSFYFNSDPNIFAEVLKFHQNKYDEVATHLNLSKVCPLELLDELEYWRVDYEKHLSLCCLDRFQDECEAIRDYLEDQEKIINNLNKSEKIGTRCCSESRHKLYLIMEKPKSSLLARIYCLFSSILVLGAILNQLLRSSPDINTYQPGLGNPFSIVEGIFVLWFTVELIIRFIVAPNHLLFFAHLFNCLDLIYIVIYYIWLIIWYVKGFDTVQKISIVCKIVTLFRLFRMSDSLNSISHTMQKSYKEIAVFFIYLFMGVLTFSTIVFHCESGNSSFYSIFSTFWYALITMTTVGYGDIIPGTVMGKIFGGCCAICGILLIAMPISLLSANFSEAFEFSEKKQKVINRYYARMEKLDPTKKMRKSEKLRIRLKTVLKRKLSLD